MASFLSPRTSGTRAVCVLSFFHTLQQYFDFERRVYITRYIIPYLAYRTEYQFTRINSTYARYFVLCTYYEVYHCTCLIPVEIIQYVLFMRFGSA